MNINFSKFTIKSRNAITRAFTLTKQCQYSEIEPQVLMVAILQEGDEMVSYLLNKMRVDKKSFCRDISNSMRLINHRITLEHDFSPSLQLVMHKSIELASMVGSDKVSLEHMFWALGVVDNPVRAIMSSHGVNSEKLRLAIKSYIYRESEQHGNVSSTSDELESIVTSFVDKLKDFLDSKFVITICVILAILGVISSLQDDSSSDSHQGNNTYSNKETMVACPVCGGSGNYNSMDIFKSQMPCIACGGRRMVPSSQVMKIMQMHTPSTSSPSHGSPNTTRRERDCEHCYGTGICQSCNGDGIMQGSKFSYGLDPVVCPNCLSKNEVGRGKCRWCSGTGKRR